VQSETEPMFFGAMEADAVVRFTGDLARFLGGDADSFTGLLLELIAKADPPNRGATNERARRGSPVLQALRARRIGAAACPA